ncbi:hypothetical protein C5L39_06095 [Corynebacterium alimapuense]|uniref:Uncharacterized protein n=2 Tax=Corynebacterium alimapuense TaxID=1576874 RepID=A0A3M8K6M0_9CORY|nr:hypothetical protein C5L39_06095 [Corynebacterium alimapuense]
MADTKRFTLWAVVASALIGAGMTAVGALGVGVMRFFGLEGVSALWSHVAAAETWYATVGWLILTLGVIGLLVSPILYVTVKILNFKD